MKILGKLKNLFKNQTKLPKKIEIKEDKKLLKIKKSMRILSGSYTTKMI